MARNDYQDENESDDPRQYFEALGAGPQSAESSGAAGASGGTSPAEASSATPDSTQDRFVSFDRYFNANAGNAKRAAEGIASGIEDQANSANLSLAQDQNTWIDQLNAGMSGQPTVKQKDGGGYEVINAEYTGPASFSPSQNTYDQMAQAQDSLDTLANRRDGGIDALMGSTGGTGSSRLNSALINRAGDERFQQLFNRYDFGKAVAGANERGQSMVQQGRDTVAARNAEAENTRRIQEESERKANEEETAKQVGQSKEYIQWLNDFARGRMAGPGEKAPTTPDRIFRPFRNIF